jgi:hypothetical protein
MPLNTEPLPHVDCSRASTTSGGNDGAAEHGDAERTDGGGGGALPDFQPRSKSMRVSTLSSCCVTSARRKNVLPRSQMCSLSGTPPRQSNPSNSSWRVCARRGRTAPFGRRTGRSSKQRGDVAVRTRSSERRPIYGNGSKPSRGGPAANSCRGCRRNTPAHIRTSCRERFSAVSRRGEVNRRMHCCSDPWERRRVSPRSQGPIDPAGRSRRRPGAAKPRPSSRPAPPPPQRGEQNR